MKKLLRGPSQIDGRTGLQVGMARMLVTASLITGGLAMPVPQALAVMASEIAQQPLLSSTSGEPNVMLMMDDSNSMNRENLPEPADYAYGLFAASIPGGGWFWMRTNNGTNDMYIHPADVRHRTAYINPQFYNPGVTYKPWNDNNKPAADNFPPSSTGVYDPSGNFVSGTPWDPRYIWVGGVRTRVTLGTSNLFDRAPDRSGPCLQTAPSVVVNVCISYGPGTPLPDGGYAAGPCLQYGDIQTYTCTLWDTYRGYVEARYYVLEGTWAADRHDYSKYRMIEIDRAFPNRMYPTPVDPHTGVRAQRADCANPISCTFAEESQNYANWYTYYRNRLFAAIGVTSNVLSSLTTELRLGYGRINYFAGGLNPWPAYPDYEPGATLPDLDGMAHPGHIIRGVRAFTTGSTERQEVFDWLFSLGVAGGTPNREALDAVGRYFSRSDAKGPWSNHPGTGPGGSIADLSCRRNYTILATDGVWTQYDASAGIHPRILDRYSGSGTPVESDSTTGPMLVGGGVQTGKDYQYEPMTEVAVSSGSTQTGTLSDVAFYYWSRDLRPDLINNNKPKPWPSGSVVTYPEGFADPATWQNMSTIILGYGLQPRISNASVLAAMEANTALTWPVITPSDDNNEPKIDDTQRAALISRGNFYAAQNTQELSTALANAFTSIGSSRASAANIGVSSAVIRDSNDLAYEASYVSKEWTGTVTAVQADGLVSGIRTERWSATAPAPASRNIVTATGSTTGVNFAWANLNAAQQTALGAADLVDYLRGDTSLEQPAGPYRTRGAPFGTFVHSAPMYSRATNFGLHRGPTAGGTDYATYLGTKNTSRAATVFINGNDGMMHAFNALTGAERFAYVPRAVYPKLKDYAKPIYDHFYLVDGQVAEGDAWLGGGWKTVVAGTGGVGPKSLFALDVTDPTAFGPSKVLFDLTDAEVPELGHITGRVLIASTTAGKWVAITGNGIESADERAVLLVIDLATGSVLKKIDTGVGSATAGNRNGMGPVTPIYNAKRDVIGVYAGDRLGNVWKFDLSSSNTANWGIAGGGTSALFTATAPGGAVQPITTDIRIMDHPMGGLYLAFGTGQYFSTSDVADTTVQSMYFIRDRGDLATVAKTSLMEATLSTVAGGYIKLSGMSNLDWTTHRGWYVNLKMASAAAKGERIIAAPVLSSGRVMFTSFRPAESDPCVGGGKSSLYLVDLASGMQAEAFDGQGTEVIGKSVDEGLPGGIVPLYARPSTADVMVSSIDASKLSDQIGAPRYSVGSGGISKTGSGSTCGAAGTSAGASALAVRSACAGVMPIRSWRDMR